jgi:hypothetical protein
MDRAKSTDAVGVNVAGVEARAPPAENALPPTAIAAHVSTRTRAARATWAIDSVIELTLPPPMCR